MPIESTLRNTEFFAKSMFHTGDTPLDENDRDKSKDYIHKEVIRPDEPYQLDFETFEFLVEKLIEREKFLNKEYDGILGNGLIDFVSEVQTIEYILYDILFPDWFREKISEFVYNEEIEYWEDDYFINKYGKLEDGSLGYTIQPDDYKNSIKITTIQGLYNYLYGSKTQQAE